MRFRWRQQRRARTEDRAQEIKKGLGARSLVLIGLMGAGKSAVGRRLAARLGLSFVDADSEIEEAAGQSISDIFAEHGEPDFRAGERRVIARLLEKGPQVLATGGGAYMDASTRVEITRRGISIWLKADLDILLARVRRRDNRPLLKDRDPAEVMARLMKERHPVYAAADITIVSRDVAHDAIVDDIVTALAARLEAEAWSPAL